MGLQSKLSAARGLARLPSASEARHRDLLAALDGHKLLNGRIAAELFAPRAPRRLAEVEFKVFSQFGDDGIIQWLVRQLAPPPVFVEFGVEDYRESNTRFLLQNNRWRGLVFDGSAEHVRRIREAEFFWQHDLTAAAEFITAENIDALLAAAGFGGDIGLLHVDIDGNDYWVWRAIASVRPTIAVIEYNAVLGPDRAITIPYQPDFRRLAAHPSGLYAGASLPALRALATQRGYTFIGCNGAGNNAYFVRDGALTPLLRALAHEAGFVDSHFRESRDAEGRLTFAGGTARAELIRGLPVVNVLTGATEPF
jgi:hypothetical protein